MIKIFRRNPIDKEVLKKIKIQKIPDGHHIRYKLFHNNDYIGDVWYDLHRGFVTSVEIDWELQRKGIITYVYDYIEKDRKIKLKPSTALTEAGKVFWKNRLKNPTDYEFLKQIKIEYYKDSGENHYYIWHDNKCIAIFIIRHGANYMLESEVFDKSYQHRELATFMYDYIEKDLNIKLKPSEYQTRAGKAFWKNRLSKN